MGDIKAGLSDYVAFYLKADNVESIKIDEPIGWNEDNFELNRHDDYHGIFYQVTGSLSFENTAKDYLEDAYRIGGINANCTVQKLEQVSDGNDVKWREIYSFKADFNTREIKDGILSLKFNSNDLAELLKSHESDEFEIERADTIDGVPMLPELALNKVELKGREILDAGESKNSRWLSQFVGLDARVTIQTEIISRGPIRHSPVVDVFFQGSNFSDLTQENLFYAHTDNDQNEESKTHTLNVRYEFNVKGLNVAGGGDGLFKAKILKVKWNSNTALFTLVETRTLLSSPITELYAYYNHSGNEDIVVQWDEGLLLCFEGMTDLVMISQKMYLEQKTWFEATPNLSFVFTHDLIERLMYIISGQPDAFYSKLLGRIGVKDYAQDGDAGLIGNISGFWARGFDKSSEKYKPLTISIKDALTSLKAVFNVGIGIETVNFKERLRIEDLKHFYRSEVVVKLPYPITEVVRKTDPSLFFSGLTFGYEKGGDYDGTMGLDEPNTKIESVTPIRKSSNKFIKTSKIRADDYGLELARRKPQSLFPLDDTRYDDSNWWLDLKRTDGTAFAQKDYTDRAQDDYLPQGIFSPTTFKGMFFTPLRMLMRHAWVFRAGLEPYLDKYIMYTSGKSNIKLTTWLEGDTKARQEGENILISELARSRFLPETINFKHPVDSDLMSLILGTTKVEINGIIEDVPNYYFKFEWTNEDGQIERGYLMNLKPSAYADFTFQKANENLI